MTSWDNFIQNRYHNNTDK